MEKEKENHPSQKKFPLLPFASFVLALVVLISYFTFFVFYENLRDDPKILIGICAFFAVVAVFGAGMAFRQEKAGGFYKLMAVIFALLAIFMPTIFATYVYYLAYQLPPKANVIASKKKAPDFTLLDTTGKQQSLSELASKQNVILVFYRGHW